MVAGHGGRTLPAGGDRRARLVFWYEPGVGLHLPDMPSFPDMPAFTGPGSLKFPEPDFPAESRRLSLFYVFIAATFLGLAGLDLYLRRRRHNVMKTNGHPHR